MENNYTVKLKTIEIKEYYEDNNIDIDINPFSIGNFNLLISDNAQGKTRLCRTLVFLSRLVINKVRTISTIFVGKFRFTITNPSDTKEVIYTIKIIPENGKNKFEEEIISNNKPLFSSKEKILINELDQTRVETFFIPSNTPAISAINEPQYTTIKLINEFFTNIVYISASKSNDIIFNPNALIPNNMGTDLASVLFNWSEKYPHIYNEVIDEFLKCFSFIKKIIIKDEVLQNLTGNQNIRTKLLAIKEDNIEKLISQINWSDGMRRLLHLLAAPKVPFFRGNEQFSPSLILVDEIENGLDFKSLKYIIEYLQDHSDDSQIIISSHSPLVCEFVHPGNWLIVKRNGPVVNFISPGTKEKDLKSTLDLFKQNHWEFYTKHIAHSKLYSNE